MSKSYSAYFIGGPQDLSKRVVSKPMQEICFADTKKLVIDGRPEYFEVRYRLHSILSGDRESTLIYVFEGDQ